MIRGIRLQLEARGHTAQQPDSLSSRLVGRLWIAYALDSSMHSLIKKNNREKQASVC